MAKKLSVYKEKIRKQLKVQPLSQGVKVAIAQAVDEVIGGVNKDDRAARQIVVFAASKEQKEAIRAAAKIAGESMSGFVISTVMAKVEGGKA